MEAFEMRWTNTISGHIAKHGGSFNGQAANTSGHQSACALRLAIPLTDLQLRGWACVYACIHEHEGKHGRAQHISMHVHGGLTGPLTAWKTTCVKRAEGDIQARSRIACRGRTLRMNIGSMIVKHGSRRGLLALQI